MCISKAVALVFAALFPLTVLAATPSSDKVVFQPIFTTAKDGKFAAGKAFVVAASCGPVLISAYHLFGEGGGLKAQIPVAALTENIKEITLLDITTHQLKFNLNGKSVTPLDAKPCCEGSGAARPPGDVFAFKSTTDLSSSAMPVSKTPANKGDRLRVLTSVMVGSGTSFDAVSLGMRDGYLMYEIVSPGYVQQATSGAPVVDTEGRVVAINLGGGASATGKMFGTGNPAVAWIGDVEAQCKK
jgi:hypothetical protein